MGLGDPREEEHHFDELKNSDSSATFFQQGEIQPETVVTPDISYGFGRNYRGQPNPVESEMTERSTVPEGTKDDEGGNPLRTDKGILAKAEIVIKENDEKDDDKKKQVTNATEPAGLGETHPVKDNYWKPGDKSDRSMGRDEMLGSVKRGNPDNVPSEHVGWEIVDVIEPNRKITEVQNEYTMPFPNGITDNLDEALKTLNVWVSNPEENNELRPYKEYWSAIRPNVTEGSVRIGVQDPRIADIINHIARTDDLSALEDYDISKISSWEEFNKNLPEGYNPVQGLSGFSEGIGQGVSEFAKSPAGDAAAAAATAAQPELAPLIWGGKKLMQYGPQVAGIMKNVLNKGNGTEQSNPEQPSQATSPENPDYQDTDSLNYKNTADPFKVFNQGVDKLTPKIPVAKPTISKNATYGENFDHPSSITERHAEPVSGTQGIDPHQIPDQSNDDWSYGLIDVNEIGSTNSPKGKDDARERIRRQMEASLKTAEENKQDNLIDLFDGSHAVSHFFEIFPLVMEFFDSDESGLDDPMIKSLHEMLEGEFPDYLDTAIPDEENEIILLLNDSKSKKESGTGFGPGAMVADVDLQPHAQPEQPSQQAPSIPDPSSGKFDPQTSPALAPGAAPNWENQTSPNLINDTNALSPQQQQQVRQQTQQNKQKQQQTQQQIQQQMQQKNQPKKASDHQGPHTDEQKDAVIKFIIRDIDENPQNYAEELAKLKGEEPLTDEAPQDLMPPAPAPVVENTPPGAGMPPQTPPMGTPEPVTAPKMTSVQLDHDVNLDMLNSVIKYAADSAAPPCPKCKGHTTEIVSQKADDKGSVSCKCQSCKHTWNTDQVSTSDGKSTDMSSTAATDPNDFSTEAEYLEAVFTYPAPNYEETNEETVENKSKKDKKKKKATLDTFAETDASDEELEVSDDTDTWFESHEDGSPVTDDDGRKKSVQESKEYDIYTAGFAGLPERGRITSVKPDSITYVTLRSGDLETETEISREEARREGYRFVPVNETPGDNPSGMEENLDTKNVTAPGQDSDLSTPHEKTGSDFKNDPAYPGDESFVDPRIEETLIDSAREWLLELDGPELFKEFENLDYEDYAAEINALGPDQIRQAIETHWQGGWQAFEELYYAQQNDANEIYRESNAKTAGKHYTPMEQRELIDEYGEARNADKLDLKNTHYNEDFLDDSFLFGC